MSSSILNGRRSIELQKKWRSVGILVNLLQNASSLSNSFSSATAGDASPKNEKNFTVSYLIDSLGLTKKLAESISRKVSFKEKGNPDSVLSLFRGRGFTDAQISTIITDYPQVLIADAEESLGPKLQSLQSRGASSSELAEIVSKAPKMLGKRGGKTINAYYDCVKEIIEAEKSSNYVKLRYSLPQGSNQENKIRNILALRELGMPQKLLFTMLISSFTTVCGKERFEESLKKVVEMGFDPTTSKFVEALNYVYQMSDKKIEEKVIAYKKLGFAEEDVWEIFKKCPRFLGLSEKKILNAVETFLGLGFSRDEFVRMVKSFPQCVGLSAETVKKKTEFLVKTMNWPVKAVVSAPAVLGYNMEKRTVPRCNVIKALISKGLLQGSELPPIRCVLVYTDKDFLNRYVGKHEDKELVAELMAIFNGDHAS